MAMNDPLTTPDLTLIERAKYGDRQAFGLLVTRYQDRVLGVVYRMCGDLQLAEDATQEAFIRAWEQLPCYEPRAPFQSWLYRIAINRALDMLRRERGSVDIETVSLPENSTGPEQHAENIALAEQVRQAVLRLPEASRAVIILREYEGLTYQEISAALDIPVGTVMSRLNYARTKLREILTPWMEA